VGEGDEDTVALKEEGAVVPAVVAALDGVAVSVPVPEEVPVPVLLCEVEPVLLPLAPAVSVLVGVAVSVPVAEAEGDGVAVAVELGLGLVEVDKVPVGVAVTVGVGVPGSVVVVALWEGETLGVADGEPVGDCVGVEEGGAHAVPNPGAITRTLNHRLSMTYRRPKASTKSAVG